MQAAAVLRPVFYIGNTGENFTGGAKQASGSDPEQRL